MMKNINYMKINPRIRRKRSRDKPGIISSHVNLLLALALVTDLLTPFLIWKGILPAYTRWITHASLAIIIAVAYLRMMMLNQIPAAAWVIVGFSLIGVSVALFRGQGILPTAWGLWMMFRYPIVGIYIYLQPSYPERFPQYLRVFCVAVLALEVIVQIGQYLTGELPGDNLAGTFGSHGTGPLVMFILFAFCLALGHWLSQRQWKTVFWVLVLGIISSILGEMKIFLAATLALAALSVIFYIIQGGQLWKLVPFITLLGIAMWAFIFGYNTYVQGPGKVPLETFIFDPATRSSYLTSFSRSDHISGIYVMRRSYAMKYGWNAITVDPITFFFGYGIGARGESTTMGTAGVVMEANPRVFSWSSLLVIMQEMGVVGLIGMAGFILWVTLALFRDIRRDPHSQAVEIRYALLLFSLLWPIWIWYHSVWNFRVAMLLYWGTLGYVFGESKGKHADVQQPQQINLSSQDNQGQ
jgi:hypothetical protein